MGWITPGPVRTRVPAPKVLTPGTQALTEYGVVVGWDTEYVERVAPDGTQYNDIVSYQFSAVWRDRRAYWLIEDVVYPCAGKRSRLAELIGHILRTCDIGYRQAARCKVLLVAHYGVAEWAALRDRVHIAQKHLKDALIGFRGLRLPRCSRSATPFEGY